MPPRKRSEKSGEEETGQSLRRSKRLVGTQNKTQTVDSKSPVKEKTIVEKTPIKKSAKSLQKAVEEVTQPSRRSRRTQLIEETEEKPLKKSVAKTPPKTKTKSPLKTTTAKSPPIKTVKSPSKRRAKNTSKETVESHQKTKDEIISKTKPKSPPKVTAKSSPKTTTKSRSKSRANIPVETAGEEPTQPLRKSKRTPGIQKPVETETEQIKPLTKKRTKTENISTPKKRLKVVEEIAEEQTETVIPQINERVEEKVEKSEDIVEKIDSNDESWEIIDDKKELSDEKMETSEDEVKTEEPKHTVNEIDVTKDESIDESHEEKEEVIDIDIEDNNKEETDDIRPQKRVKKSRLEVTEITKIGGKVYSFGDQIAGELGPREKVTTNGVKLKMNEPSIVTGIEDEVIQVVCGAMHTICLTINGNVITYGCNDDAALGRQTSRVCSNLDDSNDSIDDSEEIAAATPELVIGLKNIVKVSAGDMHSVALSRDGSVYIWGNFKDDSKKLGLTLDCVNKVDGEGKALDDFNETNVPKLVEGLDSKIVDIASGCHHILLLTQDGDVLSFGEGSKGQLGRIPKEKLQSVNSERKLFLSPQKVEFEDSVVIEKIWSSHWSSFAQSKTGDIYVWGLNNFHQLGFKTENPIELLSTDPNESQQSLRIIAELKPVKATKMPSNIKMIANGQHHMLALDTNGQVYSCGSSTYGKLGLGDSISTEDLSVETPRLINRKAFNDESVKYIACGEFCSFAITESGRLYSWGQGKKQIGTDEWQDLLVPTLVKGHIIESTRFLSVSSGSQHTTLIGNYITFNGN